MNEIIPKTDLPALTGKRCIICQRMSPQKKSEYCFRCDPQRKDKYTLPTFNKLTTVTGIHRAYGNLLNAVRKGQVSREEAGCLFYGLNGFVKSMKLILDMKIELDKGQDKEIITQEKIEKLKDLIDKFDNLKDKFKEHNTYNPSGEITKSVEIEESPVKRE